MKLFQKLIIILFALVLNFSGLTAQIANEVKEKVATFPTSVSDPEALAELINKEFEEKEHKAAAIFYWIANNISYDIESFRAGVQPILISYRNDEERIRKEKALDDQIIEKTLKEKEAICDGYTRLFKKLGDLTGIEAHIVMGFAKTMPEDIGNMPLSYPHAWVVLRLNEEWRFVDVTWAAGKVDPTNWSFIKDFDETHFLETPERFFLKHYPKNQKWLLVDKSPQDFADLPLYYPAFFNFEMEFLAPQKGLIAGQDSDIAKFKIKGIGPTDRISFACEEDEYAREIVEKPVDGVLSFGIPLQGRNNTYLTFYNQGEALVTYKIVILE